MHHTKLISYHDKQNLFIQLAELIEEIFFKP